MTTLTVYPDADPETSTVDGHVRRSSVDESFSAIRGGSGVSFADTAAIGNIAQLTATTTTNQYSVLRRAIYLFDTSSVPSGATISTATFSLYGSAKSNGLGSPELDVVSSNPASNTGLANADFTTLGTTVYGSVTYAGYSTTAYNDISLSTTAVTKNGITKLGVRLNWDTDNSFGGSWSSGQVSSFEAYHADQSGTSNDPKLVVVYSESSPQTVALEALGLNLKAGSVTVTPGAVTQALNALGLNAKADSLTWTGSVGMLLEALQANVGVGTMPLQVGAVTQALEALGLTLRTHDLSISYVTLVLLEALGLQVGVGTTPLQVGAVTQALEALALTLTPGLVGTPPRVLALLGSPETGYVGVVWLGAPEAGLLGRTFPDGGMN